MPSSGVVLPNYWQARDVTKMPGHFRRGCCCCCHVQGRESDAEKQVHADSGTVDWVATGLCFIFPAVGAL